MRRLSLIAASLACGMVTLLVAPAAQAATASPPLDIVSLGDSFASGTGAGDYVPSTIGQCWRSGNSYSELVVKHLRAQGQQVGFTNATCSGATTDSVRETQLGGVNADTDVVLLSIGGNDAGFSGYAGKCVYGDCAGAVTQQFIEQLPAASQKVGRLLHEIAVRAPHARIVLTGYGQPITAEPTADSGDPICGRFSPAERRDGATAAASMDGMLWATAYKARQEGINVAYVSPYVFPPFQRSTFAGHSLCESQEAWYHGWAQGDAPEGFLHPKQPWHGAIGRLIEDRLG